MTTIGFLIILLIFNNMLAVGMLIPTLIKWKKSTLFERVCGVLSPIATLPITVIIIARLFQI